MKDWMWLTLAAVGLYVLVKRGSGGAAPTGGGSTPGSHVTLPANPGRAAWSGIDVSSADALHNTTAAVDAEVNSVFGAANSAATAGQAVFGAGASIFDRIFGRTGKVNPVTSGSGAGAAQRSDNTTVLGPVGANPDGNTSTDPSTASAADVATGQTNPDWNPGQTTTGTVGAPDQSSVGLPSDLGGPDTSNWYDASLANNGG